MFTRSDILHHRIQNQLIAPSETRTVREIVAFMGAMQAQDYPMSKWAIGARRNGGTGADVEKALNRGEVLRTHVLRPTWHLVSAEDIRWLLDLTAGRLLAGMKGRHRELELDEKLLRRCHRVFEEAFEGNTFLEREALTGALNQHGIRTTDNRASHILFHAELSGLLCSGENRGNKQTYALLRNRAPESQATSRPDAVARLAQRYFQSHGPATLRDFTWWSGLTLREARQGIEALPPSDFGHTVADNLEYWYPLQQRGPLGAGAVALLPAFDEFIISYADKTLFDLKANFQKAIAVNGLFRSVVVIGSEIAGIWKRTFRKNTVFVETGYFRPLSTAEKEKVEEAVHVYARFLEMPVQINHSGF